MFDTLPQKATEALDWRMDAYQPYYDNLIARELTADTLASWMADWSALGRLVDEVYNRLAVATTVDTTDEAAEERYTRFLDEIMPGTRTANNTLNVKLLESGLEPADFGVPLRNIRADVEIFREANLPILAEQGRLDVEYDKINGSQTVEWEGEERTLVQMAPIYKEHDRAKREKAWRLVEDRRKQDREKYDDVWRRYMDVRGRIAKNANQPDFRAYMWHVMHRMDYTPEDAIAFCEAIEQVVVPLATKVYQRRAERLGVESVRPWDTAVDPYGDEPLKPYETVEELESTLEAMFARVDPVFGGYFNTMREENLLDLENRKGKAPVGYCTSFAVSRRPFIFMNGVGLHDDVQTLLHEGGHAFHAFESAKWEHVNQMDPPMEFAEVASMAMELLAAPYLTTDVGGFYSEEEAARARLSHLEDALLFWPYMAVVALFQHWVYTNHAVATDPANCDAEWLSLWRRFFPGMNIDGIEDQIRNRWRRQSHIFQVPFYYIEYGLAQMGAVQVYANAQQDMAAATKAYRDALAMGNTRTLPELYAAAGAKLAFDADTLGDVVRVVETTIDELTATLS